MLIDRRDLLRGLALLAAVPSVKIMPSLAQDAGADAISLAASGLASPRGLAWNDAEDLFVAVAGEGGAMELNSGSERVMAGGNSGVMVITDGCPAEAARGLPSTRGMSGHEQGPAAVAFLDGTMYVLQDSAGTPNFIQEGFPNGVYAATADGGVRLVADISTWMNENPVAHIPYDKTDLGETFAMLAGKGELWVLESNSGQVLTVTPDGRITRVVDLSENHPVPTGFALAPDGGVYVGYLTPAPYTDGSSRVDKVTASGEVTEVWSGLTMVTGLAVDSAGTLYAIEMSTGNTDAAPFTQASTGRVVRQTGPSSHEAVVTGIDYPIAAAIGPDGGLYVSFPAFAGDDVTGGIARIDIASITAPVAMPADLLSESRCAVPTPTAETTPPPAATEAATAEAPAASPPALSGKTLTGAVAVDIKDFAFVPADIRITTGTVVTWTNSDPVSHTATEPAGAFNSENLNQGQSFSFTFRETGTFNYICSYHPFMKGIIEVVS